MKKSIKILISICVIALVFAVLGTVVLVKYGDRIKNKLNPPEVTERPSVRITFPEGLTIREVAKQLEENGVCSALEFEEAANKYQDKYSFDDDITNAEDRIFLLEGYIFPDTYDFYIGEGADAALSRFLNNTQSKLKDEYYERAKELGYTMDEIITIASIIQEEASFKKEMGKVSSVLHNRLNSSYNKLECDVTINYINGFGDDVKEKYKGKYNTYDLFGLPAGPISNPGVAAIEAALYPEDTKYLFFVTDDEMNYYYAETYKEHLANCKKVGL